RNAEFLKGKKQGYYIPCLLDLRAVTQKISVSARYEHKEFVADSPVVVTLLNKNGEVQGKARKGEIADYKNWIVGMGELAPDPYFLIFESRSARVEDLVTWVGYS